MAISGDKSSGRLPPWLHRKLPRGVAACQTRNSISSAGINTVCEEAKCPNKMECWSRHTATVLVMGKQCTRACAFCDIAYNSSPPPLDPLEASRVVQLIQELDLKHLVITMVTRDDLPDGGAEHLAFIIREVRKACPKTSIEVLTSDFQGLKGSLDVVLTAKPQIFSHNIETVRRLTPRIRHKATYDRSLEVLRYARASRLPILVKSGMMVGLGETEDEVKETITDLFSAGCDIITIGQYLQARSVKIRVKAFISPQQFKLYEEFGLSLGVRVMYCGPFVRSSYNADSILLKD